jgi:hypothetical protein
MHDETPARAAWPLFWNGIAAFIFMAILVAAQVAPPPGPQGVPLGIGLCILGLLLVAIGNLAAFTWQVLSVDAGATTTITISLRREAIAARETLAQLTSAARGRS